MTATKERLHRPQLADGCLWGLAPQSSPLPICAVYRSSALGEHSEPRLPARTGRSGNGKIRPGEIPFTASSGHSKNVIYLSAIALYFDFPLVAISSAPSGGMGRLALTGPQRHLGSLQLLLSLKLGR